MERSPIVLADAGPLIRLAAAGLLDGLRQTNAEIVLVDRVIDEVTGDPTKPYATDVAAWIAAMGPALRREATLVGEGIAALRARQRTPEEDRLLRSGLRDSGEQAMREFAARWAADGGRACLVVYEDQRVPLLFLDADFEVRLMTTRAFAAAMAAWGVNADAVAALEAIADRYALKPALIADIDPATPPDLRVLPSPTRETP